MPFEFDNATLDSIENSGAVVFGNDVIVQRSLGEVLADQRAMDARKNARFRNPAYIARLNECREFLKAVKQGEVASHILQEVLSTSDFPILFGDILDLRLLNFYNQTTPVWRSYAQRGTVQDFRQTRIIALDGLQDPLYPSKFPKPELATVQYDNTLAESQYNTQVQVYERGVAYNWRMLMDRRGAFLNQIPMLLGRAALRTESKFAVSLFMDSTGFDSTFFSNGNANLINTTNGATSNNPPLSVQGLRDALNVMYRQVDSGGDPIMIEGVTLVVPPMLRTTALEILRANQLEIVPATSALGTRYTTPPWVNDFNLAVEWYMPNVASADTNKHTNWAVFADPNVNRPGMEVTFLEGYERPSLWQKAPNTQRVGGSIDPLMGDFQDGSIHQKIMHILGGTLLDPKAAVASNGSGT
jgi:hypothetical protein